eukprot:1142141-Pelagomonas_calceolata.AAC.1
MHVLHNKCGVAAAHLVLVPGANAYGCTNAGRSAHGPLDFNDPTLLDQTCTHAHLAPLPYADVYESTHAGRCARGLLDFNDPELFNKPARMHTWVQFLAQCIWVHPRRTLCTWATDFH